jgi:hypothetical protein
VLAEATAGTVPVQASLDRPNTSGHDIDVTVADNGPGQTATAGADYTFTSPTVLHIAPGQQSASTTLTVKDDSLVEDDGGTPRGETVAITTSTADPSVASVADPTVPVRIADDDVVAIGTAITVRPVILQFSPFFQINLRLSANLHTTSGVPIAGQTLTFSAWFGTICTATTNSAGDANCSAITHLLGGILGLGYRVSYAGSPPFTASSADGGLL